jgi:tRNA (cytidine/uridine-2'-O-)-methyltransferase
MLHIVLVEPEIPPNTGNVARLCAATETMLHLVGKLGFKTDDRALKRAGLDYWPQVKLNYHGSLEELQALYPQNNFYYFSTKAEHLYTTAKFSPDDFLVFGKETKGLPEKLIFAHLEQALKIPMTGKVRSINLSSSVAIALYEALRQIGYPHDGQ